MCNDKCGICGTDVVFERKSEAQPHEYDVCSECGTHVCPNCGNNQEVPLCVPCSTQKIAEAVDKQLLEAIDNLLYCGNCGATMGEGEDICRLCDYPVTSQDQMGWEIRDLVGRLNYLKTTQDVMPPKKVEKQFDNVAKQLTNLAITFEKIGGKNDRW